MTQNKFRLGGKSHQTFINQVSTSKCQGSTGIKV